MIVALFWTLLLLSLAGMVAYLFHGRSDSQLTLADGLRLKWLLIAMVAWAVGGRALATEVTRICATTIDPRTRSGNSHFIECSPQLLGGGPAELFTFGWTWLPPLVAGILSARYLLRIARERFDRQHKADGR